MNTTQAFVESASAPVAAQKKRGRPAKYANSADRQAAFRAANVLKTVRLTGKTPAAIAGLAAYFDTAEADVLNSLIKFALANRNWHAEGLTGWAVEDKRFTSKRRPAPATPAALDAEFPVIASL